MQRHPHDNPRVGRAIAWAQHASRRGFVAGTLRALAFSSALLLPCASNAQEKAPDAAAVRAAATEFEAGLTAYDAERFDEAAEHFEAADGLAPNPEALRATLSARDKAGHAARAATAAAQAQRRYPKDAKLQTLAADVLERRAGTLHRVQVTCSKECVLSIDDRKVSGPPTREAVLYVEPGKTSVSASFPAGGDADRQLLVARAGGRNSLHFMARAVDSTAPGAETNGEPAPAHETPAGESSGADTSDGTASQAGSDDDAQADDTPGPDEEPFVGWSPVVFFVALGSTAVLGGVTIWSGVDTLNNPGEDVVREQCVGLGTDCPEYQEGRDKQLRTNVLIGVTAGVAALTGIVGLFLTDWGSAEDDGDATAVRISPSRDDLVGLTARF